MSPLKVTLPPKEVLRNPDRRWAWVVTALKQNGQSLTSLATKSMVNRSTLYNTKRVPYPRGEAALARAFGVSVQALFPDRYDEHGVPLRRPSLKRRRGADYPQARAAE